MTTLHINREKLKQAVWGKGDFIADKLGISKGSLSRKLSGQQQLLLEELNVIASTLGDDTITFLSFTDEAVERWQRQRRGRKANFSVRAG